MSQGAGACSRGHIMIQYKGDTQGRREHQGDEHGKDGRWREGGDQIIGGTAGRPKTRNATLSGS